MAHIVCMTSGLTGILHASFELVARLEADGHRVTYACPKAVGPKVKAQGFEYIQLPPVNYTPAPELPNYQGKLRKLKRLWFKFTHIKSRQKASIEALGMTDFEKKMTALQPDLWIMDVELHEHIMCAVGKKQKVLLLSQWFSLWQQKGLPPLLHDTIPGEGWRGSSIGMSWTWWLLRRQRWWIFLKKKIRSGGTNRRTILKKYAQEVGFPLSYIRENYWPGPFSYSGLPVISMTAEALEFPHEERKNLRYVGPMVFENRTDIQTNLNVHQQLEQLFLEKKLKAKSLIYCSVSTYRQGDQLFLKKLIQAVKERTDWMLILGLGGLLDTDFLKPCPQNVHAFGWIPQLKVLAEADISINHGGIHTINECVHFRVPMLVYSGKKSDQNGCAARVHYHKIGIMADKDLDDASTIEKKIHLLLSEEQYKTNMEDIYLSSQKYKTEKSLEQTVDLVLKKMTNQT